MLVTGEYLWGEGSKQRAMFERGGTQRFKVPVEHVDRPDVVKELELLLRRVESNLYGVVIGEHGTGKSRAVQDAVAELDYPKGVVYFSPSCFKKFGKEWLLRSVTVSCFGMSWRDSGAECLWSANRKIPFRRPQRNLSTASGS
jgi:hypothetical protein